jgi:hypothetical protein
MDALSQLDVSNPDHVSVITRDGKITVSVTKDGSSVTLGFPIRTPWIQATPRPPLQQPAPQVMAVKKPDDSSGRSTAAKEITSVLNASTNSTLAKQQWEKRRERKQRFTTKLTAESVKEMKEILSDPELMSKFNNKSHAYQELGRIYGVSACRVMQIANGKGWVHIQP